MWLVTLGPHGLQHARLLFPSLTPKACSNPCPSSRWCHPTISSSVAPSPDAFNLSQHLGLLLVSQLFTSGGQRIRASVLQWLFGVVFLWDCLVWSCCIGNSLTSLAPQFESINSLVLSPFLCSYSHICLWLLEKTIALTIWNFVWRVMSLFAF